MTDEKIAEKVKETLTDVKDQAEICGGRAKEMNSKK